MLDFKQTLSGGGYKVEKFQLFVRLVNNNLKFRSNTFKACYIIEQLNSCVDGSVEIWLYSDDFNLYAFTSQLKLLPI